MTPFFRMTSSLLLNPVSQAASANWRIGHSDAAELPPALTTRAQVGTCFSQVSHGCSRPASSPTQFQHASEAWSSRSYSAVKDCPQQGVADLLCRRSGTQTRGVPATAEGERPQTHRKAGGMVFQ